MSEVNKAVIRAYAEAFSAGDFERVYELHAPDAVVHGVLGWGVLDEVVPIWRELHAALAIKLEIKGLCAEGDLVAARYAERGVFKAPFRGKAPTGKSYELVAMEWYEMKKGLIHRRWGVRDLTSLMRQVEMPAG